MGRRDLTPEQAVAYAIDPRNDRGPFVVMAQNYDSDCPNYDDHDPVTGECKCWDGITSEDVETWTEADGSVDLTGFAEWGPFQLWFEGEDPGEPQPPEAKADGYVGDGDTMPTTPEEALDLLSGYIDVSSTEDTRPDIDAAFTILTRFIKRATPILASIDDDTYDEWGEPGDCWERIVNDDDILAQFAEEHEGKMPDLDDDPTRDAVVEWVKAKGLGRHYGAHCIWCLQAP